MLLILALIAATFSALALWKVSAGLKAPSDGALLALFTAIVITANLAALLLDIRKHRTSSVSSKPGEGHGDTSGS